MPGQNNASGVGTSASGHQSTISSSNLQSTSSNSNTSVTKNQLEQLNTMREALFSQDGWGCQHVNQDTNWEVSVSPEPQILKEGQGASNCALTGSTASTSGGNLWKNVNNGTELWEANLRNGGQASQTTVQKTPWGHTPSSNLGGTWGEDDDANDSNVWGRGTEPITNVNQNSATQWNQQQTNQVPTGQQISQNNNSATTSSSSWNDSREITRTSGNDIRSVNEHRPNQSSAINPTSTSSMNLNPIEIQSRQTSQSTSDPIRAILDQKESQIRGDPRGISGRLNGSQEMWGQQTNSQSVNIQPKPWNSNITPAQIKHDNKSGWEEPSPPQQRRNVTNYDDGTSLWGQRMTTGSWKEEPTSSGPRNQIVRPVTLSGTLCRKTDNMWGRNSGWEDNVASSNVASVFEDKWIEQNIDSWSQWDNKIPASNMQPKIDIRKSNSFHGLLNMGFKKDDIERALVSTNMNFDEALELLSTTNASVNWRRPVEEGFEHASYRRTCNNNSGSNFQQSPTVQTTVGMQQKFQNNVTGTAQEPTAQQLRMLVQQIQMAVQSGYLSNQILNQPLAPATLVLLNQLLSSIKHLQSAQTNLQRGNAINSMQISVNTIAKYKQQITTLQSQINAQQAIYIKQQQQIQHQAAVQQQSNVSQVTGNNSGNPHANAVDFLRNQHDALVTLQSSFSDLNIGKQSGYQSTPNPQSRLNQWKLPVLDAADTVDFSRTPGASSKLITSNIGEGAWTSGRNINDGWTTENSNEHENKDWPSETSPAPAFTDLVPEFEPGKPWKGSQIKSVEDDPTITPGSVARSPLSINPMPKDASDIFSSTNQTTKNSPTDLSTLSLSSSTWSFNANITNQNFPGWSDSSTQQTTSTTADLWGAPLNKSTRPPPGLANPKILIPKTTNVSLSPANWIGSGRPGSSVAWNSGNSGWATTNSNWLILKNLNNQIDGSTLCTLCKQHGPLLNFQLFLNQGLALCKYQTREEAAKALMALNNCVLGNVTILVESPSESEVQNILAHLPSAVGATCPNAVSMGTSNGSSSSSGNSSISQTSQNATWRNVQPNNSRSSMSGNNAGTSSTSTDAWNAVWQTAPNTSSLWSQIESGNVPSTVSNNTERTTPSNLKSLLPENLLELN